MLRDKILNVLNADSVDCYHSTDYLADAILATISEGCKPVYQVESVVHRSGWIDCSRENFEMAPEANRRILYTASPVVASEPIAWVRRHPDGALTAEFLEHSVIEPCRKSSGAWVALFTAPQSQQPDDRDALIAELKEQLRCAYATADRDAQMRYEAEARLAAAEKDAARYLAEGHERGVDLEHYLNCGVVVPFVKAVQYLLTYNEKYEVVGGVENGYKIAIGEAKLKAIEAVDSEMLQVIATLDLAAAIAAGKEGA